MNRSLRALLVLCVGAAAPLRPAVPQAPPTVAVLPFTAVTDTADAAAAESLSRNVAASLARGRGVEVSPWSLVRQAQLASGGDPRRIAQALGVRYVVDGALLRRGILVRLVFEVVDGRDGRKLLADSYDFAAESLAGMADSVASVVALQVVPVRLTPRTTWKPPALLWIYLLLLAATIVLAARKRTSWLSLVGVAILPPYFIWVLWDAWRSPVARGKKGASTKDIDAKVDALIFKFKDPDRGEHESSVWKMIALGEPAVERLIQYLQHEDEWARCMAAAALGKMKDPRAIEPLRKALNDPDQGVRHMAGLALNELAGESTTAQVGAYRSAPAGMPKETPKETPKPPLADWASMKIRPHLIQKTEILARDISGVRAALAERRTTTRAGSSWALLHLSFSGYKDDPRALWEIPEVREWCATLLSEFQFLPFLLEGESCRHFLPCVLPVEVLERRDGTQQVKIGGVEAANTMQAITVSGNALCRTELSPSDPATAERLIEQATERLVSALQMNIGGTGG